MARYKFDFSETTIGNDNIKTLLRYCSLSDYLNTDAVAAIMGFEKIEGDTECTTENVRSADLI